ncbi:MAG TPA: hypothetical protein VFS09_08025 [Candidatus Eisenbacteria bacterium]|nr:hypothetical protein [Candidatus Eisenbacteria bacterium]
MTLLLGCAASVAPAARAQVFQISGGTSSQYHATGGTLNVRGAGYDGWIGLGDLEQFRFGALARMEYQGGLISAGDQAVPFGLPTDIFQAPHSFFGRGFGFEREIGDVHLRAIGGTTATVYGSPFFTGAQSVRGAGILFLDHDVSPTVHVLTRSIFSDRQTVISGLDWRPSEDFSAAFAGGGGAGEPYGAVSARFERPWIAARAAWTAAADAFRRVAIPQPSESEMERENIDVKVRPVRGLVLQAGRYHFLQPETPRFPAYHGEVHQLNVSASVLGAMSTVGLYDSRSTAAGNRGISVGLERPIGGAIRAGGNYFHAVDRSGQVFNTVVGVLRESVSPHLDLTQVLTHTDGNSTLSFGGNFVSSRFSVGAEWQTVYVPFGEGNPFQQALMLNVRLLAFGGFTANVGSYLTPDGQVKYTLGGNQYVYRGMEGRSSESMPSFSDQMVQGIVTDEKGSPVRGAAIKVDGELVYTDSDGYFFVRKPKGRACKIEVATSEFVTALPYIVVSAPETLIPQPEGRGSGAMIVVRPYIPGSPAPQPKDWTDSR